jgi:hypothetical protein
MKQLKLLLLYVLVAACTHAKHTKQHNDPVADPKFPEVNVQYGAFGSRFRSEAGFAYPACTDKIQLDASSDSVTSCGGFSNCTVYCLDPENRYDSTYNCSSMDAGATSGLLLVIFLSLGFGMCCGGGGVWCYYRKKYGQPYSGYIEINA